MVGHMRNREREREGIISSSSWLRFVSDVVNVFFGRSHLVW